MRFEERLGQVPAAVLFCDVIFLIALMGGAAITDEDSSGGLDSTSGEQTCAGDGDEGIAGGDSVVGPAVEGEGVPVIQLRGKRGRIEAHMVEQVVGGVKRRKGGDERTRKAFAFQPGPGPGGVDLLEVRSAVQLVCEFEVVIDAKDCEGDLHRNLFLQLAGFV